MRDLFRNFRRERVEFLLIGGQATVVYGAAQFTQDFDVWVKPTKTNLEALLRALSRCGARYHKLTPPVTLRNALRGHGFHFLVPTAGSTPVPLDVMARPPRVGAYASARRRARRIATPWGTLRVVAPEDLVLLKRTNRPGDYDVVARLVRLRLDEERRPSRAKVLWAAQNTLILEPLQSLAERHFRSLSREDPRIPTAARILARRVLAGSPPSRSDLSRAESDLLRRLASSIRAGRDAWSPVIAELRELRRLDRLAPEGARVRG